MPGFGLPAPCCFEVYGGVGHSFTNPEIAKRGLPGFFAYDERADRRSWSAMLALLHEAFD